MPRKSRVFDYAIPDGMDLERGDMVKIPFRDEELFGMVARVKNRPVEGKSLKSIIEVVRSGSIGEGYVGFFERLAVETAQSPASVLYVAIPTPPIRPTPAASEQLPTAPLTIPSREAPAIASLVQQMDERGSAFVTVPDLRRTAAVVAGYFQEHSDDVALVVAPNVRDARLLADHLGAYEPHVVTGEESNAERFAAWRSWRTNGGLLVGTRVAMLLPNPDLTVCFLARSGHENHKQSDRNPRFDVREATMMLRELMHTKIFFLDVLPRVTDVVRWNDQDILQSIPMDPFTVVRMDAERPTSPHPMISFSACSAIEQALTNGKQALLFYNRKGVARRLRCEGCDTSIVCETCAIPLTAFERIVRCPRCKRAEPIPLSCPTCKGTNLRKRGYGIRSIESALKLLFESASVVAVEKDSDNVVADANIIVATRNYHENLFDPFRPAPLGAVIELDADIPLNDGSTDALVNAMRGVSESHAIANASRAPFLLQTDAPDLFESFKHDPITLLRSEAETRKAYDQTPFRRAMVIAFKDDEPRKTELALSQLEAAVREKTSATDIHRSSEGIVLLVAPEDVAATLGLFADLDDRYIIDTSAKL